MAYELRQYHFVVYDLMNMTPILETEMITREQLQGQWNQVKGQIREKWGQFSDDDLQRFQGNGEQLVGMIQEKTGATRQEIERFLDSTMQAGSSYISAAAERTAQYTDQARKQVQQGYDQARQQVAQGYDQAQQTVRARPMESLTAAFGAGIVAGVLVGLLLTPRR
ncbi:CsbD family protein [Lacunimicrobium album]